MAVDNISNTNPNTQTVVDSSVAVTKPTNPSGFKQLFNNLNAKASNGYDKHVAKKFGLGIGVIVAGISFALVMDNLSKDSRNTTYAPQTLQVSQEEIYRTTWIRINAIIKNLQKEYYIVSQRDYFGDDPVIWNRVADFKVRLIAEYLLNSSNNVNREDFEAIIYEVTNGEEIVYSNILMELMGYLERNPQQDYRTTDLLVILNMLITEQSINGPIFCADVKMFEMIDAINQRLLVTQEG